MKTVYLEVFILDNMIINYYFLYLAGAVIKLKIRKRAGFVSAVMGTAYACLQVAGVRLLDDFLLKILLSVAMVYISYMPSKKNFFRLLFCFYGFSFAFGGIIVAMLYSGNKNGWMRFLLMLPIPLRFCVGIIGGGYFVKKKLFAFILSLKYTVKGIMIDIVCLGRRDSLRCFGDTGNCCEYFGKPVVFVNRDSLGAGKELKLMLDGNICESGRNIDIVYIPYKTARGVVEVVPGFRCDDAVLRWEGGEKKRCVYVGLVDHCFGGEPCLINPGLLE